MLLIVTDCTTGRAWPSGSPEEGAAHAYVRPLSTRARARLVVGVFSRSHLPVVARWVRARRRTTGDWPRVHIADAITRGAVVWALTGAAQWLNNERCRGLLSEYLDTHGRPLTERLEAHGLDVQTYLTFVLFRDGSGSARCADDQTFAFTTPRGRVVFVCGRRFERVWRASARLAQAVVIHEMLHTLGLGENPPTSRAITERVLTLCDTKPVRNESGIRGPPPLTHASGRRPGPRGRRQLRQPLAALTLGVGVRRVELNQSRRDDDQVDPEDRRQDQQAARRPVVEPEERQGPDREGDCGAFPDSDAPRVSLEPAATRDGWTMVRSGGWVLPPES